jgi:NAD(P)-dependent dehydrogenase (short-subunit alcohol dehydrogenase family)
MAALDGRVAVITGAGRGIGREHAVLFAKEGAKVVVNDLGGDNAGQGADSGPAHDVVDEITGAGGAAVANTENIATWSGAESVVRQAIDEFGRLDVLVNNAGILRDSFIAGMAEAQWDAVIAVHLKGHFAMLHHAAAYWKAQSKAGDQPNAAVINTASGSGVTLPNAGQANYGSAKAGIAALTLIAAEELEWYGVRVNAIAPIARTRLTLATPGMGALIGRTRERRTRSVQPGEHLAAGGLSGDRQMPDHRKGVCRSRRSDFAAGRLARCRDDRDRRRLGD